jgi:hypothetical protein
MMNMGVVRYHLMHDIKDSDMPVGYNTNLTSWTDNHSLN